MSAALTVAIVLAGAYIVGVLLCVIGGFIERTDPYSYASQRRHGARLIVRSPLWPLDIARAVARGVQDIRDDARTAR